MHAGQNTLTKLRTSEVWIYQKLELYSTESYSETWQTSSIELFRQGSEYACFLNTNYYELLQKWLLACIARTNHLTINKNQSLGYVNEVNDCCLLLNLSDASFKESFNFIQEISLENQIFELLLENPWSKN